MSSLNSFPAAWGLGMGLEIGHQPRQDPFPILWLQTIKGNIFICSPVSGFLCEIRKFHVDKTWRYSTSALHCFNRLNTFQLIYELLFKVLHNKISPLKNQNYWVSGILIRILKFSLIPAFEILFKPQLRSMGFPKLGENVQGDVFCLQ